MNYKPWLKTTGLTAIAIATMIAAPHEGLRLKAYPDVGGVWTICYGHTHGVKRGDTATLDECKAYLAADMPIADAAVSRCINTILNVNQRAAFDDAVYNLGPKVVCGSTLQRMANDGDFKGACNQLKRWVYAAGQKSNGLIGRRADDTELCLTEPK